MNLDVPSVSDESSFIVDDKTVENDTVNERIDENAVNIMLNLGKRNRRPPNRYIDNVMVYDDISDEMEDIEDEMEDNDSEFIMDEDDSDDDISLDGCENIASNELDLIKSDFKTVLNVSLYIY